MSSLRTKSAHVVQRNGIFFTPPSVARVLARGAFVALNSRVLDPACGEGALLSAVKEDVALRHPGVSDGCTLVGCDKLKHQRSKTQRGRVSQIQKDFFDYYPARKFDAIVMNPPYLAGGRIKRRTRDKLNTKLESECRLSLNADLWAYFIVKASQHLLVGGTLAAILPWSFLQADYSTALRKWLAESFGTIKVLVLGDGHFAATNKRVLLLWLTNYGSEATTITVGFASRPDAAVEYAPVTPQSWGAIGGGVVDASTTQRVLLECAERHRFQPLEQYSTVRIGVVTGANSFFIRPKDDVRLKAFLPRDRTPIITSARDVSELRVNGSTKHCFLLGFRPSRNIDHKRYLEAGRRRRVHERSHAVRRNPWHAVDLGDIPDAFFHYRVIHTPFIALNGGRYQSTNAVHRLYFKNLSLNAQRWIQVSALSVFGQLSIETMGRVYGNGMLKIEPSALKRMLVWTSDQEVPEAPYSKLEKLISSGDRKGASRLATRMICDKCSIPLTLAKTANLALAAVRLRRR